MLNFRLYALVTIRFHKKILKFRFSKMRFACLGIASSTTLALRVNFNSKNPSCVHNVDDCNSLNGNCCANQEMCGVQECFQCIIIFFSEKRKFFLQKASYRNTLTFSLDVKHLSTVQITSVMTSILFTVRLRN